MPKLRVLRASPGRIEKGRFRSGRRNITAGFYDEEGIFHPIRASADYDPGRGGDRPKKRKPVKKKPAARKAPKRKPGPKREPAAKRR